MSRIGFGGLQAGEESISTDKKSAAFSHILGSVVKLDEVMCPFVFLLQWRFYLLCCWIFGTPYLALHLWDMLYHYVVTQKNQQVITSVRGGEHIYWQYNS